MITADTITDEQIRELRANAWDDFDDRRKLEEVHVTCGLALAKFRHAAGRAEVAKARARCAEILNARPEGK